MVVMMRTTACPLHSTSALAGSRHPWLAEMALVLMLWKSLTKGLWLSMRRLSTPTTKACRWMMAWMATKMKNVKMKVSQHMTSVPMLVHPAPRHLAALVARDQRRDMLILSPVMTPTSWPNRWSWSLVPPSLPQSQCRLWCAMSPKDLFASTAATTAATYAAHIASLSHTTTASGRSVAMASATNPALFSISSDMSAWTN